MVKVSGSNSICGVSKSENLKRKRVREVQHTTKQNNLNKKLVYPTSETDHPKRKKLTNVPNIKLISPLVNQGDDDRPFLRIKVGQNLADKSEVNIDFLLDTGTAVSLLHEADFAKLNLPKSAIIRTRKYDLTTANGTLLDVTMRVTLRLTVGGKQLNHPFYVTKGIGHSIMGWDAIKIYSIILANGESFVDKDAKKKLDKLSRHNNVIVKKNITLQPGETRAIVASIHKPKDFVPGEPVLINDLRNSNSPKKSPLRVVTGVYDVKGRGNVNLQVFNLSHDVVKVHRYIGEVAGVFDTIIQPPLDA